MDKNIYNEEDIDRALFGETEETKKEPKEKEKKEEDNIIKTSFFTRGTKIYEQFYDNGVSGFISYDMSNKEIVKHKKIMLKRIKDGQIIQYLPQEGEEIEKEFILLPSAIEEYGTDEKLEEDIKTFIRKWLDVDEEHLQYVTWGIKQSWIYDLLNTINYFRAMGDTGQGKTRYLDTLGALFYKPISTSGASTAAPIFRIINKWRGTLVIDEADFNKSDETMDIIKIINLGFEKRKPIMRCDKNEFDKVEFFDPYCPKIIATRKPFEDKATESRCFTKIMIGTERKDIPFIRTKTFFTESHSLRNKLLLWRFRNYNKIDTEIISKIDLGDLEPRIKQTHIGFLPLFAHNEEKLEQFKKYLQEHQNSLLQERRDSLEGYIVTTICEMLVEGQTKISVSDIINKGNIQSPNDPTKPMSPIILSSKYLTPLGLSKRETERKTGEKTKKCIVFDIETIKRLSKRYAVELPEGFKMEQQQEFK